MSKRLVEEALDLVTEGRVEEAMARVASLDPDFVSKRLRHHMSQPQTVSVARRLWQALHTEPAPRIEIKPSAVMEQAVTPTTWNVPRYVSLDSPSEFLSAPLEAEQLVISLKDVDLVEVWALVGMAALGRDNGGSVRLSFYGMGSPGERFAAAVGLEEVLRGRPPASPGEPGRTVILRRLAGMGELESLAQSIARLALPSPDDAEERLTLKYVVVELLRNAVQHSADPLGGVVAAQRMDAGYSGRQHPSVQVAVADHGIGIQQALSSTHPDVSDPLEAVVKALEPHISGTFEQGGTGSLYNAGLGLFFIAEMTKLTAGKLLIATRGATITLRGDPDFKDKHDLKHLHGVEFPGTLVAFEMPLGSVADYDGIIGTVAKLAAERTPKRVTQRWLTYEPPPAGVPPLLVHRIAEDTVQAHRAARETLEPRLVRRQAIALDFRDVELCTQSFLHALLYETLRVAWAWQVPVHVVNAGPGVRSGLSLVENYALGG